MMKFATGMATLGLVAGIGLLAPSLASAATPPSPEPNGVVMSGTNGNTARNAMQPGGVAAPAAQGANTQSNAAPSGQSSVAPTNAAGAMTETAVNQKLPKKTVMAVQEALSSNGQNVKDDGVWGPKTASALKQYQQKNGLAATGQLDQATRAKLNVQG